MIETKHRLITRAEWNTLPPRQKGFVQYWQGDIKGSQLKFETNPYREGTKEFDEYQRGEQEAMLEAQDSEG